MIDRDHALPLAHQAQLLELSRGSLYYVPVPISQADLELMREIDRLHTDYPFCGARMLRDLLRKRGYRIGRTKSITREHLPLRVDDQYQIGRNVIWQYVHVRHKERMISTLPLLSQHTVSIWVADTEILFRPVGEEELLLIRAFNFAAFPPRLPEQPIFYPVCNVRYAEEIASKWNAPGGSRLRDALRGRKEVLNEIRKASSRRQGARRVLDSSR